MSRTQSRSDRHEYDVAIDFTCLSSVCCSYRMMSRATSTDPVNELLRYSAHEVNEGGSSRRQSATSKRTIWKRMGKDNMKDIRRVDSTHKINNAAITSKPALANAHHHPFLIAYVRKTEVLTINFVLLRCSSSVQRVTANQKSHAGFPLLHKATLSRSTRVRVAPFRRNWHRLKQRAPQPAHSQAFDMSNAVFSIDSVSIKRLTVGQSAEAGVPCCCPVPIFLFPFAGGWEVSLLLHDADLYFPFSRLLLILVKILSACRGL